MKLLKTIFDWIIVAVGAVFLLAFIIFLVWFDKVRFIL